MIKTSIPSLGMWLLFAAFGEGCNWQAEDKPMQVKTKKPILIKQNFRSTEKDGYKVEVWTDGMLGFRIGAGYRIYLPKENEDGAPETDVQFALRKKDAKAIVREANAKPILKATIIDGGYWESIRIDAQTRVERKEKFVATKGVWETRLDDPLSMLTPKGSGLAPGHYSLSMKIIIKNGPTFQFDDLPFRHIHSRDPFEFK